MKEDLGIILPEEHQKMFFRPICNEEEIERIFNVQNANDYLLKVRAETIIDHMRLYRVYRHKALADEKKWSLEKSFSDTHYVSFLLRLNEDDNEACKKVTYGDVFSNEPNGSIFQTEYGPITTISNSLKYFLKFTHLALIDFKSEVPMYVRMNALRIAIRVMMQTEALDFDVDPRGLVPKDVAIEMNKSIPLQMQFIAGHEFSHFLLNHLSDEKVQDQPIYSACNSRDSDYGFEKVYGTSQLQEFDADVEAIIRPNYTNNEQCDVLNAALLWFGCLELYETARNIMNPPSSSRMQTHPSANERFDHLLTKVPTPLGFDTGLWKSFSAAVNGYKKLLEDDVAYNFDDYERYGSMYLDAPNTEWRGRELVDRVDY